ncbi:MAG: hypothetical protein ABFS41_15040, partial [Myxococcota bacterium]
LAPALVALLLGLAVGAAAQPLVEPKGKAAKPKLDFAVTVLHASPEKGGIDPGARRFDRLLRSSLRYESLRVVKSKQRHVELNEIERVRLPTGDDFRFRPIDASDKGVLVSVDSKTTRGDFRLPRGKPLILGGQPYEDGQLVVILEAE